MTKSSSDKSKANPDVVENAKLCAEQGWKGTFHLKSGEVISKAYITGTNWDLEAVSIEKIGERHVEPRVVYLKDVSRIEVGWS